MHCGGTIHSRGSMSSTLPSIRPSSAAAVVRTLARHRLAVSAHLTTHTTFLITFAALDLNLLLVLEGGRALVRPALLEIFDRRAVLSNLLFEALIAELVPLGDENLLGSNELVIKLGGNRCPGRCSLLFRPS